MVRRYDNSNSFFFFKGSQWPIIWPEQQVIENAQGVVQALRNIFISKYLPKKNVPVQKSLAKHTYKLSHP